MEDYPIRRLPYQKTIASEDYYREETDILSEDYCAGRLNPQQDWERWNKNRCSHTMVVRNSFQDAGKE